MTMTRRDFARLSLLASALAAGAPAAFAQARPRVVILGGGAGGATAALMLRRFGGPRLDITLIEENPAYSTCFFSNWVLAGLRSMDRITFGYDRMRATGITVVTARAESVDRDGRAVVLADGTRVPYDRLLVAPGVSFDFAAIPGYDAAAAEIMPHAWKAGPQTVALKARLDGLSDGATVVMSVPDNPYRCPPGPYERASVIAHVLKAKGHGRSKIVILDGKEKFSKQALFQEGWERLYPGMIEWLPPSVHGGVERVDPATMTVVTGLDDIRGDLVNVIPPQKAGAIAVAAGLTDPGGWCPVRPENMASADDPRIFVVGDACRAGEMPKSAFSAASQAKFAALMILAELIGRAPSDPRFFNTCWSLLAPDEAVKVGAAYTVKDRAIVASRPFVSAPGESAEERRTAAGEAEAWFDAITADMFG